MTKKSPAKIITVLIFFCTAVIIISCAYISVVLLNHKYDSTIVDHTIYPPQNLKLSSENFSTQNIASEYDPKIPAVDSTIISRISLNTREKPELLKFIEVYAHYHYEKGILGNPITNTPIPYLGGTYLPFTGKYGDRSFHAITCQSDAHNAYAIWGVIGDYWIHGASSQWGYPIGLENEQLINGKIIISQAFVHGLVKYSNNYGITFFAYH